MATKKPAGAKSVSVTRISNPESNAVPVPTLVIPQDVIAEVRREGAAIATRVPTLIHITNDSENSAADLYRSSVVKPKLAERKARLAPIRANVAQLKRQIDELCGELLAPYEAADREIKSAMEDYARRKLEEQRREVRRIEASRTQAAEVAAVEEAQQLLADGNDTAAQAILERVAAGTVQPATSMPAIVLRPPTSATSSTAILKRYDLLDVTKLLPAYTLTIPNAAAIQGVVTQHGKAAEKIVGEVDKRGEGLAIRYREEVNVRTRSS